MIQLRLPGMPDEAPAPSCTRCGRVLAHWPLERGDRCAPRDWVYCIRPDVRLRGVA